MAETEKTSEKNAKSTTVMSKSELYANVIFSSMNGLRNFEIPTKAIHRFAYEADFLLFYLNALDSDKMIRRSLILKILDFGTAEKKLSERQSEEYLRIVLNRRGNLIDDEKIENLKGRHLWAEGAKPNRQGGGKAIRYKEILPSEEKLAEIKRELSEIEPDYKEDIDAVIVANQAYYKSNQPQVQKKLAWLFDTSANVAEKILKSDLNLSPTEQEKLEDNMKWARRYAGFMKDQDASKFTDEEKEQVRKGTSEFVKGLDLTKSNRFNYKLGKPST